MKNVLVYLACPYSHPDMAVKIARFEAVNKMSAKLMSEGQLIFSPISHSHPIAVAGKLPGDWQFWEAYDRAFLAACCKLIVLRLPGWETSTGVTAERKIAEEMGIPVEYVDPI